MHSCLYVYPCLFFFLSFLFVVACRLNIISRSDKMHDCLQFKNLDMYLTLDTETKMQFKRLFIN